MKKIINKLRQRRKKRIRAKICGTMARPRLSVFRSNRHIYAQLIDDSAGKTLAAVHSREIKKNSENKTARAKAVGLLLAQKAKEKGIKSAVFDRSYYKYHGRIKALAEACRENGLKL